MGMDTQQEKQEQIIRFLVTSLAAHKCEQLVFDRFVQELRERKEVAILELLRDIRESHEVGAAYASAGMAPDVIVSAALGNMPLDEVERLIRNILPEAKEPK
jgi:hypothetical protein